MRFGIACLPAECLRFREGGHAELNAARLTAALTALRAGDPRLSVAVLPQHCLTATEGVAGADPGSSRAVALLAAAAGRLGLYVAAADRFRCGERAFILGPDGQLALEQQPIAAQSGAAVVEVLATPFGDFACLAGGEPLYPEYVRLALFRGAEYLLNPTAERADHRAESRHLARGARAWENLIGLASASMAGTLDERGTRPAVFDGMGNAEVWSHHGELLGRSDGPALTAMLDTRSLRKRRAEPWVNFPAQLRTSLYAAVYDRVGREAATPAAPRPAPDDPVYDVLVMQAHQAFVTDLGSRDATIADNLGRALALARPFCARPRTRLAVFPEFFLQGTSFEQSLDYWERAAIRIDGPEVAALAGFARDCDVYLCGAVLEYDPDWPRRFFNTAIIVSPAGEVVLRYRKLQCADLNGLLNVTTPGNVYSAYVERYGIGALVPWVDTPIGRLGAAVCFDSNWPELWRALALQGVEVVCHPTSEIHSERCAPWGRAKRTHAAENLLYIASANAGSEQFHPSAPITGMNRGHSALIDFDGRVVACADGPGTAPLLAQIDLGALRRARADELDNPLLSFHAEAVAEAYREFPGFPLDCFGEQPMLRAAEGPELVRGQIARLTAAGVFKAA